MKNSVSAGSVSLKTVRGRGSSGSGGISAVNTSPWVRMLVGVVVLTKEVGEGRFRLDVGVFFGRGFEVEGCDCPEVRSVG